MREEKASPKRRPRQSIYILGHHGKPLTDDLAWDLIVALRPGHQSFIESRPITAREEQEMVERWKGHPDGFRGTAFYYPRPEKPGTRISDQVELVVNLQPSAQWMFSMKHGLRIPLFEREKGRWFLLTAGRTRIDYDSIFDMAWLMDKVHPALRVFEPDFVCAGAGRKTVERIGEDPRTRVWPILLYGPSMVAKLGGRERLLEAPAWRVDELSWGALWIQVAENPFLATPGKLKKLAEYLGLET